MSTKKDCNRCRNIIFAQVDTTTICTQCGYKATEEASAKAVGVELSEKEWQLEQGLFNGGRMRKFAAY